MGDVQLSGTSAFPREEQRIMRGINYCMYLPKEDLTPGEKWVNNAQKIGAAMENPICSDPKLWECSLLCVLSDSFSFLLCSVWCAWHWDTSWRGAVCHRVTAPHLGTFCHLHVPAFSLVPKNPQQRESGIWLLGRSLRRRKNYWGLSLVFAAAPVWSPVHICCDPAQLKGFVFSI